MKKILRFLTQRVVLTALLILIQALLLFGIIWKLNNYFIYFYAFSVLLSLLLTLRIINNKSNPALQDCMAYSHPAVPGAGRAGLPGVRLGQNR